MIGLKPRQRVVLALCLCALALPLGFAVRNTYRFMDGYRTATEGYVACPGAYSCQGKWHLPGSRWGSGGIEGLGFAVDGEGVRDIPVTRAGTGRSPTALT